MQSGRIEVGAIRPQHGMCLCIECDSPKELRISKRTEEFTL